MAGRRGVVESFLRGLTQAPQNAIGTTVGLLRSGKLPTARVDPEGNPEYVYEVDENASPMAMGEHLLLPRGFDPATRPEDAVSLAHERVHSEQSRRMGPAYLPASFLGGLMSRFSAGGDPDLDHPLEDEAYLRTEPSAGLSNRLAFKKAVR